jgi:hypothetical protein
MRQLALALALLLAATDVARADSGLFNKASKVVLAHNGDRTVLTMASDVKAIQRNSRSSLRCRR